MLNSFHLFKFLRSAWNSVFEKETIANSSNEPETTCSIAEKIVSFKSQFIPNTFNKLESTMDHLDNLIIDPDNLMNHIIFDIIVLVLYIMSLISHILSLIDLYNDHQTIFRLSISFLIAGTVVNTICGLFYAVETTKTISKIWVKIITIPFIIIISLPFSPIIYLFGITKMHNCSTCNHHNKLINLFFYCLCVSVGQSILMTYIIVSIDYNIYYILSLFSCIGLMLIYFISICAENKHGSLVQFIPRTFNFTNQNDSFITYSLCLIIDYSFVLFSIIFSIIDKSNIITQIWIYNTLIASLMSFFIIYKEIKYFGVHSQINNASFSYIIIVTVFILYSIFFQIIIEISCTVWIVIIYNYIRKNMTKKDNYYDWNLIKWISKRDTIQRLCITNGLTIDEYCQDNSKNKTEITLMKDYIWSDCKNNFKRLQMNHMKQVTHFNWYNIFFGNNSFDLKTKLKVFTGIFFVLSRVIKFILLPCVQAILILPNMINYSYQWKVIIYSIFTIQLICVVIVAVILINIYNEIYCSLYVMGVPNYTNGLRNDIGYYYNATSVYQLHCMIKKNLGPDIAGIIISYLHITDALSNQNRKLHFHSRFIQI
eukprot:247027_1